MPKTVTKEGLLALADKEFSTLSAILDSVPENLRLAPHPDADGVTAKDTVGHRAQWIVQFLGWYDEGQRRGEASIPALGYKWNQLKAYNAALRADQAGLSWDDARAMLDENHAKLMDFIERLDQDALYGGPMKGGSNAWTTGRWAEAAGPSHYRSAAKYIRGHMKALA